MDLRELLFGGSDAINVAQEAKKRELRAYQELEREVQDRLNWQGSTGDPQRDATLVDRMESLRPEKEKSTAWSRFTSPLGEAAAGITEGGARTGADILNVLAGGLNLAGADGLGKQVGGLAAGLGGVGNSVAGGLRRLLGGDLISTEQAQKELDRENMSAAGRIADVDARDIGNIVGNLAGYGTFLKGATKGLNAATAGLEGIAASGETMGTAAKLAELLGKGTSNLMKGINYVPQGGLTSLEGVPTAGGLAKAVAKSLGGYATRTGSLAAGSAPWYALKNQGDINAQDGDTVRDILGSSILGGVGRWNNDAIKSVDVDKKIADAISSGTLKIGGRTVGEGSSLNALRNASQYADKGTGNAKVKAAIDKVRQSKLMERQKGTEEFGQKLADDTQSVIESIGKVQKLNDPDHLGLGRLTQKTKEIEKLVDNTWAQLPTLKARKFAGEIDGIDLGKTEFNSVQDYVDTYINRFLKFNPSTDLTDQQLSDRALRAMLPDGLTPEQQNKLIVQYGDRFANMPNILDAQATSPKVSDVKKRTIQKIRAAKKKNA